MEYITEDETKQLNIIRNLKFHIIEQTYSKNSVFLKSYETKFFDFNILYALYAKLALT